MDHPVFEFDGGLCHVMDDKIVFNQSSNPEERFEMQAVKPSDFIFAKLIPITFVFAFVLAFAFRDPFDDFSPIFLMILALVVFVWFYDHGVSQTNLIPLENLLYVKYKTVKLGERKGYFVFHFKDENGNKKRRFICMRPFESQDIAVIKQAKSLLLTRGFLQDR